MPYRFFDHTADVAADLQAADRDGLFVAGLEAFTDTITPLAGVEPREARRVELEAEDARELLVTWLEELLFLYETEGLVFRTADVSIAPVTDGPDGLALTATLRGEPQDPDRHPTKVLIKGVTYHELAVEERPSGWHGRVIFDI